MAKKSKVVRVGELSWPQDAWDRMLADADHAAEEYARRWPRVTAVRYDRESKLVVLDLNNGAQFTVPADKLQGVATATEAVRSDVRILGPNWAIEFPKLDEQFTVESLLTGVFGNRQWMTKLNKTASATKISSRRSAIGSSGRKESRPKKLLTT